MKTIKKVVKLIGFISIGIVAIVLLSLIVYSAWATSSLPHVKMCKTLGFDPKSEPLCDSTRGIFQLIEERFPIGTTSREEIQSVLGEEDMSTSISRSSGNLVVNYKVTPPSIFDGVVSFIFDENDMLIEIRFYD